MLALTLFTRLFALARAIGPALRGGYARSALRASAALSCVMESGGGA